MYTTASRFPFHFDHVRKMYVERSESDALESSYNSQLTHTDSISGVSHTKQLGGARSCRSLNFCPEDLYTSTPLSLPYNVGVPVVMCPREGIASTRGASI